MTFDVSPVAIFFWLWSIGRFQEFGDKVQIDIEWYIEWYQQTVNVQCPLQCGTVYEALLASGVPRAK